jgi:hypothetical protein
MQTNDSVAKFVALRAALLREREAIHKRLQQIDAALGSADLPSARTAVDSAAKRRGRPPRSGNGMSIREAITKVTSKQPLGLSDLVEAVQRIGYKFESNNPRNSVGAYLYSPYGKKHFRRTNGKFSPLK